jgi:hypothetical protein
MKAAAFIDILKHFEEEHEDVQKNPVPVSCSAHAGNAVRSHDVLQQRQR